MSKVFEIAFKIGAQMAGNFSKTMLSASGTLKQLNNEIGEVNKQQRAIGALVKLREETGNAKREFLQAQQRVQSLAAEIAKAENPSKELNAEFAKAKTTVSQLKSRYNGKREALDQLNKQMGMSSVKTADLKKRQQELIRSTEKAAHSQRQLANAIAARDANLNKRAALRGQMVDMIALGAVMRYPVKTAMDFQQSMAEVGAVSKASADEMTLLTKTARQLGRDTNWSAMQTAEGMKFLSMAGFNAAQTAAAMPGMLSLASAGTTDLGTAADIASNILTGFNLEASEMARVADVLTNGFTSANTTLPMFGESMKYVAPVSASLGVSIEQTAAMIGKLGDAGIQASQAGTSLRTMMVRLSGPTPKAEKALAKLGVKTTDSSGNLRDMSTILADLNGSMANLGTGARAAMVKTIFGVEAGTAATVLLGQAGSGALQEYTEKMKEQGSAARVAKQQNDTATGAFKRMMSATESVAITVGNHLLPPLATAAEAVAKVANKADGFAERFPLLTKVVVVGTAAILALTIAVTAGAYAFSVVKGAYLSAKVALLTFKSAVTLAKIQMVAMRVSTIAMAVATKVMAAAQWLLNSAMYGFPLVWILAAIAGVVAAGIALYKNWDWITAFFSKSWEWIKSLFQGFDPIGWMMSAFSAIDGFLSQFSLYESGKAMLQTLTSGIVSAASAPIEAIKSVLSKVRRFLPFSDAKEGPFSELTKSGAAVMKTMKGGMESVPSRQMAQPIERGFGGISDVAQNGISRPSQGSSGSSTAKMIFNFTQEIVVGASTAPEAREAARRGAEEGGNQIMDKIRQAMDEERRLSFA